MSLFWNAWLQGELIVFKQIWSNWSDESQPLDLPRADVPNPTGKIPTEKEPDPESIYVYKCTKALLICIILFF